MGGSKKNFPSLVLEIKDLWCKNGNMGTHFAKQGSRSSPDLPTPNTTAYFTLPFLKGLSSWKKERWRNPIKIKNRKNGQWGICYSLPPLTKLGAWAVPGPSPVMFRVSGEKTKLLTHFPGTVGEWQSLILEGKHAGLCTQTWARQGPTSISNEELTPRAHPGRTSTGGKGECSHL